MLVKMKMRVMGEKVEMGMSAIGKFFSQSFEYTGKAHNAKDDEGDSNNKF
jgi:hypothetical protein